ncbi:ABC transporter ATP-binding protein [Bifidobacterium bifidum]|jgi:peptide/nickel transport system ATP-binding protein|uniref:ABC transporter ATP-binding protein n=3 Tax=Bifidobacterium bifidum TaxID=1681 RepID=A0AB36BXP1_BIFBI|nr:ABC transporter ATP-binding protein [Bifidobacterium bifidum]GDY91265.1 oligopeptide ABC transporter ATP-binding protein OppF [Bifidobacteriaceae bacterium MCC01946]KXS27632.1 MAG: peptide ABC transporter ATP-binding protein [Bifidobacterium bifidum]MBA4556382.1 ABC transporter ATP-binding protein [Bifidobacterium bifidum]MBI6590494.1 ABC transporter ATP-binding protein [Bifidobacterium bifidum]MBP0626350.1 ABC transporter ATP-binding protein [Bifidobacterium bifidum]
MKNNKSKGSVSSEHKEIVRDDILQYELLEGNGPKGAPKGDPIMQVRDLHVSFATEAGVCRAVRGVNFDLWRGRTLGIVGESGSGKSVTALSLIGLLDDNAKVTGSIIMNGEELIGKTDEEMSEIRGERIAMVFQDPLSALTPMFTIGDQIAEGLITHHPDMSKQQIHDRCVELLELVGIPQPEERLSSFPHQFSGGMRQRVMIAIAIANNPDVIIADEPTTALDVTIQAQILDVLAKAQKETGAAVVLITHDLGVVAGAADDILVMYAGRPVERASIDDIFQHPSMPYTMGLLGAVPKPHIAASQRLVPIQGNPPSLVDIPKGCPFSPRCPLATPECSLSEPNLEVVDANSGHLASCRRLQEIIDKNMKYTDVFPVPDLLPADWADVPRDQRPVTLEVDHLVKHFPLTGGGMFRRTIGQVAAVDDVTFKIRQGETLALVGESGSGKSTTLMEIMNLMKPEDGRIVVLGHDLAELKKKAERKALRKDLQIIFQDPMSSLDPRMPIYDVLAEPLKVHKWSKEKINRRIGELMELVGLNPDYVDRFPAQFSGGQRQRISIARALATDPKVLLLDEPIASLDVSIQAGIINLLEDLQAKLKISYLFVAHDLAVIRHISDRVAVMYLGQVVELGETEDVFTHPRHPYTQALLSAIPVPDPVVERTRQRIILKGDLPSPSEKHPGCRFASRCPVKLRLTPEQQKMCETKRPVLTSDDQIATEFACHFPLDVNDESAPF